MKRPHFGLRRFNAALQSLVVKKSRHASERDINEQPQMLLSRFEKRYALSLVACL